MKLGIPVLTATLMIAALGASTAPAPAAPLTFHFEGYVDFIHDYLELDDSVYVGAPLWGEYKFDPTGVTDAYPENPNVGSYYFGTAGRMWAQIGSYEFVTLDLGILVWNDLLSEDVYQPISRTPFLAASYQWIGMVVLLNDDSGTALDSDALPFGVPALSDFPTHTSFGMFLPGDELGIRGTLTSLTPEPGSVGLMGLGAAWLAIRRGVGRRGQATAGGR